MSTCETRSTWTEFLRFVQQRCSATAFENWISPIKVVQETSEEITLEVPNVFVKEYLLSNYEKDLCNFLPERMPGKPAVNFVIAPPPKKRLLVQDSSPSSTSSSQNVPQDEYREVRLNHFYVFKNFIEGPSNQFVKSACMGVATRPGQTYNPLFIHGGVGLGKTHLLHSIGHYVREHNRKLRIQCITTEAFINDLVDCLRNKSVDKMKRYYRSLDVLLVDDIQFLQNRLNFEEEFCNTFESLINQGKQIVITSDKPPGQLKLSERMIARMEWGLVTNVGIPDLETRVAILKAKAEQKGLPLPNDIAFYIAEHIMQNVRQLEGAVNRLNAHCRLLNATITIDLVEKTLKEMIQHVPQERISVEQILKAVAAVFNVKVMDLKGSQRTKDIALPRQVAMYLAKEMINDSLMMLGASFGKTHSTILHACKSIEKKLANNENLRRRINMVRRNVR